MAKLNKFCIYGCRSLVSLTNSLYIFSAFEDGLSKPMVDLLSYILDILFDSFGKEIISDDDDIRNYDDVGKLGNDSRSTFYRYSDASDEESYRMKPEEEQHTVVVGTR